MSDADGCDPCLTGNGPPPTLCDGDTENNSWVEGGICLLDTMSKEQVIFTIEHNPEARKDLARVTTCQEILDLLDQVTLLPTKDADESLMKTLNNTDILPFYTIFRGNLNNM